MVKILSSFDTRLPQDLYIKYSAQYGQENVIFVRRGTIYLVFMAYLPLLRATILLGAGILGYFYSLQVNDIFVILMYIVLAVVALFWFYILYQSVSALMNYYLDFTIVTPQQIISYDQHGIFTRNTRAVEIEKIKLVSVNKKWFLRSLFNYGSIEFFAEGDGKFGDLWLDYIADPVKLRDKVAIVMGMDKAV